mmetsp:Transcript_96484/g.174120  ORF Transcript_96484/g.174120 Transcript_96484/m.174120 type:complete len:205 (-) Transcript_96484:263-877(-)
MASTIHSLSALLNKLHFSMRSLAPSLALRPVPLGDQRNSYAITLRMLRTIGLFAVTCLSSSVGFTARRTRSMSQIVRSIPLRKSSEVNRGSIRCLNFASFSRNFERNCSMSEAEIVCWSSQLNKRWTAKNQSSNRRRDRFSRSDSPCCPEPQAPSRPRRGPSPPKRRRPPPNSSSLAPRPRFAPAAGVSVRPWDPLMTLLSPWP